MCVGGGGGGGDGGAAAREAAREERENTAIASVNNIFNGNRDAREASYEKTGNDVNAFYTRELDDQRLDADRATRFTLARRGVAGGSSDIDANAQILEDYNKGVIDIDNRAQSAVTRLRSSDESARLDLISRIRAGLSGANAVSSANEQLRTNLETANQSAQAQSLGQVFKTYGGYQQSQAVQQGRDRAYRDGGYGTFVNPNPGNYSGRRG